MHLFGNSNDWAKNLKPILIKYKGRKHPLEYHSLYQLMVMVVLSAGKTGQIDHHFPV